MEPETLLADVKAFLAESGMRPSTFGVKAVNDGHLLKRLEKASVVYPKTAEKIQTFIADERKARAQ